MKRFLSNPAGGLWFRVQGLGGNPCDAQLANSGRPLSEVQIRLAQVATGMPEPLI